MAPRRKLQATSPRFRIAAAPVASTLFAASLAATTAGCLQGDYLMQAVYGQDEIGYLSRPIDEAIADPTVPAATRARLSMISDVKGFGERHGLKPTSNYEKYADLKKSAVVWVVTAAKPLRFERKTWSFPIVGSVPYLGWFNRRDAERYGDVLKDDGWDVDVRTASAYSTLGWFNDPILSTMVRRGPGSKAALINVVLHESVHATYYVSSQSTFNESLADFIADHLTVTYLNERVADGNWELYEWQDGQLRGDKRAQQFHATYKDLEKVYKASISDEEKLERKQRLLTALQTKTGFRRKLNNATLASASVYHGGTNAFGELFDHCGQNFLAMWKVVKTITSESFDKPQADELKPILAPLLAKPCVADEG